VTSVANRKLTALQRTYSASLRLFSLFSCWELLSRCVAFRDRQKSAWFSLFSTLLILFTIIYLQALIEFWETKSLATAEIARAAVITPFKVIQGHWFWYQSKARMRLTSRDGTGSSGSRVTGSPGHHFEPGRVGSRVSVQYTWPGLLTRIRRYKNVLSVRLSTVSIL